MGRLTVVIQTMREPMIMIHGMTSTCRLDRRTLVGQAFYRITPLHDVHQRHTRNFPYPSAELPIASCNDEAAVGSDTLDQAVVRVGSRV